jgi:hypothetical protein
MAQPKSSGTSWVRQYALSSAKASRFLHRDSASGAIQKSGKSAAKSEQVSVQNKSDRSRGK